MPTIQQIKEKRKITPVIEIGGTLYEGKDHGEAIKKAEQAGEDISNVNREKDGMFMVDGKLYTREEAKKEFGISHSHEIGQPKVLITTDEWLAPALALKIQNEGINIFLAEKRNSNILKGTIKRIPYADRLEFSKECDLVIYEDKSNHGEVQELRKQGISVLGGSKLSDKLELDRMWGNKIAKQCGIKVPEMLPFTDFKEMATFIKERKGKWVLKQCGKIDEIKGLSFVAKMDNSEDLLDFLPLLEKNWVEGIKPDFVLQEKVEGHEFAIGSFFNGKEFMKDGEGQELCEENFEHKALFPGGLGESTGEQYTIQKMVRAKDSKLFMETLDKCRELLKAIDYRGDFDINCIINEKGAYFLEFTPRMGVPSTIGMIEIHKSSWYELLKCMADGTQPKDFKYDARWNIVSWAYCKPFPAVNFHQLAGEFDNPQGLEEIKQTISFRMSDSEGILINFKKDFTKEDWSHIHPDGIRFRNDRLEIANKDGYILTATAMDDTVEGAGKKLEDILKKIIVPRIFWRNDFDRSNYHKSKYDLEKWGYLLTPEQLKEKITAEQNKKSLKEEENKKVKNEEKRKVIREKLKKLVL